MRISELLTLSQMIFRGASRGLSRTDFLRMLSDVLMESSGADAIEIRMGGVDQPYRWVAARRPAGTYQYEIVQWTHCDDGRLIPALDEDSDLERLCRWVSCQELESSQPFFTQNGSFWTEDTWESMPLTSEAGDREEADCVYVGGHYRSLAVIRFLVDEGTVGLLHLKHERPGHFSRQDVEFLEAVAQTLGLAIADRRAHAALRERVKELTCLYGIARLAEDRTLAGDDVLQGIAELLPPAWQHPEIAAARITIDGHSYLTPGFAKGKRGQCEDIVTAGRPRGTVEVVYLEDKPELADRPFLREEESLISAVAREIGLIIERREADEEKTKLQTQLIHADRLATIGQLAAGVAHELNEPLGSILGVAQLAAKAPEVPEQARQDLEKIIASSLYAREVIKKLMVFARQMPPAKTRVNLNQVIRDGLYFLQARCAKDAIDVECDLARSLPEITADPVQLNQVLVNLVVNAVQAMPGGGTLEVSTRREAASVLLAVHDTGVGMSPEVREKVFLPFFTTKDVDEGTGLGLALVHGIIVSHGGTIDVASSPGEGTRFEIRLPLAHETETEEAGPNVSQR